jgi:hypothetical protein
MGEDWTVCVHGWVWWLHWGYPPVPAVTPNAINVLRRTLTPAMCQSTHLLHWGLIAGTQATHRRSHLV